jgi:hypothetical protein
MHNPSEGRPAAMWNQGFDFTQPLDRVMSPAHQHEFGVGFDVQYKDRFGNVQAQLDGLRPDEAELIHKKNRFY